MSLPSNQQRQHLKQKYGKLYDALTRLLAEDDPKGLVTGGAPHNEYEPEVDAILLRLHKADSPSALGHLIYEIFVEYFGATCAPSNALPSEYARLHFEALGERAWMAWKQWEEKEEHEE